MRSLHPLSFCPALCLALSFLTPAAHAQEKPFFVTYSHDLEEPGNLEIETKTALARGDGHKRPSLRSALLRSASDGDIEWSLRQGDLAHGMPSWSSLPTQQRWQLIAYLRSIQ